MKSVKNVQKEDALSRVSQLCADAEQCEYDIRQKLKRREISGADADAIIDYLIDRDFLNEHRYAKAYCHDKLRFNGWGRQKIKSGLMQKRLDRKIIENALQTIDENEYVEILKHLLNLRMRRYDISDYNQRNSICRYLIGRGFEPWIVFDLVKNEYAAEL